LRITATSITSWKRAAQIQPGQARFAAEDPNRFTLMGFIAASARR